MKKLSILLALCLIVLAAFVWLFISKAKHKEEIVDIDITDTGFEYDVAICDKYFQLIECIIDNDSNEDWSKEMRLELKSEVKKLQEKWWSLDEDGLTKKCKLELENIERDFKENNLDSFGCSE